MKLCKDFLKPGLPAVRCMVRLPVPPPAYPAPRPAGQAALRAAFGGGLRPPPMPRPSAGAALRARLPLHPPPPDGFTARPTQACPPAPSAGAQPAALRAARRPAPVPAAPPPPLRGRRYPPRPLFPLKSPQSLANVAKIRIIKWYISYRKGEQKLWQIKRKW